MVLGTPRSGTTWLANLLTTDSTLCLHDPLIEHTPAQLDVMQIPGKKLGIADTAALTARDWVVGHPAKKIVLWRDVKEVNVALGALGFRALDSVAMRGLAFEVPRARIYHWESIFHPKYAKEICDFFNVPWDVYRHQELIKMNIQPQFSKLPVDPAAIREFVQRVAKAQIHVS